MLEKSLSLHADSICYDLEDSVSSKKKWEARRAVSALLDVRAFLLDLAEMNNGVT